VVVIFQINLNLTIDAVKDSSSVVSLRS